MNDTKRNALLKIAVLVTETVRESGPMGAPGGTIYAALMTIGISLEQYEQIMSALLATGLVRRQGECYFATSAAKDMHNDARGIRRNGSFIGQTIA